MERNRITIWFAVIVLLLCIAMGFVVYRVSYFSYDKGKWAEYGEKRLQTVDTIPSERGNIYDCNNRLLSSTLPQYTFYLDMGRLGDIPWKGAKQVLTDKKEAEKATMLTAFNYYIDSLSYYLSKEFGDRTASQYKKHLQNGQNKKSGYYRITSQKASYQQMMRVKDFPFLRIGAKEYTMDSYPVYKSYLSGLISDVEVKRKKPYGSLAYRTIGEIDPKMVKGGLNGLEFAYDSILRGENGLGRYVYATINVSKGKREVNQLKTLKVTMQEPASGRDVIAAIDIDMQEIAQKALHEKVVQYNAKKGMAALMEVKTGRIKAMANLMQVSEGAYVEGQNEMLVGYYEPGSTFKTASMMAALEDNVVHIDDPALDGEGGEWKFQEGIKPIKEHNWRRGGYKSLTIPGVLHNSSNIGIAKIVLKGYRSDPERFLNRLESMGITKPMQLELSGSTPQVNHPSTRHQRDKNTNLVAWSATTLPWMSFGYELQLPPIYTLAYYNAIANNGTFLRPLFAQAINNNGKTEKAFAPDVIIPEICSSSTLSIIQDMLLGVVEEGTGKPVKSEYMKIAGKTGTAQTHTSPKVNVSFCGYFPADNPQYTCFVMLSEVDNNLSAGKTAGEVFKNIAEQIYVANLRMAAKEAKDTIHAMTPTIKSGKAAEIELILKNLNIAYTNNSSATWIRQAAESGIQFKDIQISQKATPNVTGMGAKDAVYLLESAGLRVRIAGRGKVAKQSLSPGAAYQRGQTIEIQLN